MQEFEITMKVTINTISTVSEMEVKEFIKEELSEFNVGIIDDIEVKEI